jgi:branched-chain amino acid transport system ATP-binding protein
VSAVVLRAENLQTFYGKSHILYGVSLEVREGEIVTLLGRNGAGKTTTLRSLVGLTPPREGRIQVLGRDTTRWRAFRIARLGVGYVPEGRRIFPNLTVLENLTVPMTRPGHWTIERIFELFPNLGERRSSRGRQLSGGEQEMLAIARALLVNPQLLLLDEPSQGLAPLLVREVFRVVASMREQGISILLVEQNARFGLEVADRVYVLNDGRIVHAGPAGELARNEAQVRALAGAGAGASS